MDVRVELIGLCVLVMSASGFVAVLPDFDNGAWIPGPNLPDHLAIIAAPDNDIVSEGKGWKGTGTFTDRTDQLEWKYFVIDGEGVRFENVEPSAKLPSIPAIVPQLKGLCDDCSGIQPKYLTPGTGASSHIYVTSGTVTDQMINGRIDTIVALKVPANKHLIINAGGEKVLVLNSAKVRIANYPVHDIEAGFPTPSGDHDNHFLAYYKLASTWLGRRCKKGPIARYVSYALGVQSTSLGAGCSNSQYP